MTHATIAVCRGSDCTSGPGESNDGVTAAIGVLLVDHSPDGRRYTLTATTFHFDPASAIAAELLAAGAVAIRIELVLGHRPYVP